MPHYIWTIICIMLLCSCEEQATQTSQQDIRIAQVKTMTIQSQKWQEMISAYGVIEAAKEVQITVEFSAKIKSVFFKEGQTVKRGQQLITFDSTKRKLRLQNAEQSVKDARARLHKARQEARSTRKLFMHGNAARTKYDATEAKLRQAMAQYEQSLTATKLAMRELRESRLISPVTGVVEKCNVHSGETILPGQLIGVIQVVETVRVATYVSEKDINHLRIGSEARVTSSGVAGYTYSARVEALGIKADTRTGNFPVKLMIENKQGLLRPGMTAKVVLQGLEIQDAIVVPDNILVDRQRRKVLYIVKNNAAEEIEPVIGTSPNDQVLILQGLHPGDKVITSNLQQIVNGSPVKEIP
ncbi:efflux RND transporter periplasmic adaptor subunit [Candidatus Uabimicrobium amorphum]|uniref:efflux RND transporter periplasmic adaptor subunit n=1 Tax=Uabimicrobium amorphum TaxID=2596890 RepID=UPI001565BA59|nr:efflux RND transporter periplasmic adaptor subunit [Candidatus Uabimicrobium amorphum]